MVIQSLNILAIGRNADIMQVIERLINAHPQWKGRAVTTDVAAIAALQVEKYDIALLCAGIGREEEGTLKDTLLTIQPSLIIERHYGGGSGLLENEILAVLEKNHISLQQ